MFFFFSSRRRHTRFDCDWSSDVCSSDLAGTARFASPLGTEDFVKRSSVIEYSLRGLAAAAPHLRTLTRIEGLAGHGRAARPPPTGRPRCGGPPAAKPRPPAPARTQTTLATAAPT